MEFNLLNWNIGGAKYLEEKESKRKDTRKQLNRELRTLIEKHNSPYVVTLQEIVHYGTSRENAKNIM